MYVTRFRFILERTPASMRFTDRQRRRRQRRQRMRTARLKKQVPYVAVRHVPRNGAARRVANPSFSVATYNVHRWTGLVGGSRWSPALGCSVITELDADIIALQEVLRPFDDEDPLQHFAEEHGFHLAFVVTRIHRNGELGNAILSRWPMEAVYTIDLSFSRLERRSALAARFKHPGGSFSVVATHLALVDRTRHQQVHSLLEHPRLRGPVVLLGDMNAWRRCRAMRRLDDAFTNLHDNQAWPPSYPSARPVLALDRIYARGARLVEIRNHVSKAARRGSDHLPVLARIRLDSEEAGMP